MSYSEQIRHPDGALNPQREKNSGLSWWWFVYAGIAALILVAVFRPQWFAKIGLHISSGASKGVGGINPRGWV